MSNTPKLSITIPTRNQGPYIMKCLDSLRQQSFHDFEVIIQDGLSSDETLEICSKVCAEDPRFKFFHEKDYGQSDAINKGLARSNGEYWTWICSDDFYFSPTALEKLVERFDAVRVQNDHVVGVYGKAVLVRESGDFFKSFSADPLKPELRAKDFQLDWPLAQPASIYLKSRVDEVGGVDGSLHLGMDLDLFLKMLKDGRYFCGVDCDVAAVRLQPDSKSVKLKKQTAWTALQIIQKHFSSIGELRRSQYAREYIDVFVGWVLYGNGKMKRAKTEWQTIKWWICRVWPYRIARFVFLLYLWFRFDSSMRRSQH